MLGLGSSLVGGAALSAKQSEYSIKLDGTDDHLLVDHHADLKPTAALSYSAWVNLDTAHGATGWVNPDGNDDHNEFILGCVAGGGYGIDVSYSGTANNPKTEIITWIKVGVGSGGTLQNDYAGYLRPIWGGVSATSVGTTLHEIKDLSGWIHLAVTFDGRYARMYINSSNDLNDGAVDTSATQTKDSGETGRVVSHAHDSKIAIGADISSNTGSTVNQHLIGGLVDDVAVWSVALDQDDIDAMYAAGPGFDLTSAADGYDKQAGLEAWWKMEEGAGTTVADSSSNSNTATLTNSPSWSTETKG